MADTQEITPGTNDEKITVIAQLTQDEHRDLKRYSIVTDQHMKEVVRDAIIEYLNRKGGE